MGIKHKFILFWNHTIVALHNIVFAFKILLVGAPALTIFSTIVFAVVGLLPVVTSFFYKLLIDAVTSELIGTINLSYIIIVILIYIFLLISTEVISYFRKYVNMKIGLKISHYVSILYLKKFKEIDLNQLDDPQFYNIVSNSRTGLSQHPERLMYKIIDIFENLISFIGYLIIVINYSPFFVVFCIASWIITSIRYADNMNTKYEWEKNTTLARRYSKYFNDIQESGEYIPEMRIYNLAHFFESKYKSTQKQLLNGELKLDFQDRKVRIINNLIRESVELGVQLYLSYLVILSKITIGEYTLLVSAVGGLIRDGKNFINSAIEALISSKELSYLKKFLEMESSIIRNSNILIERNCGQHKIEFKNVSFRYNGASKNALSNISFIIYPGETVTLVGGNGSGKSTIMKLLLRLYEPTEGDIYIDDVNLQDYNLDDYYAVIGAMFQNSINYSTSIEESIWFGDMRFPLETVSDRIDAAIAFSCLRDTVAKIDGGKKAETSTRFVKNSFNPSGGELQKLSLARTFFRKSELIILDEPSASLDAISEKKIFEQIYKMKSSVTTIVITHRLSDVHTSDRVMVLNNGALVESGTHQELMFIKGQYYEMYKHQSEHYT